MLSHNCISKEHVLSELETPLASTEYNFYQQFLAHISEDELSRCQLADLTTLLRKAWKHLFQTHNALPSIKITSGEFSEIYVLNNDLPFIIHSIRSTLYALDYEIELIVHPVLTVERDASGQLLNIHPYDQNKHHESFVYIRLSNTLSEIEIETLKLQLHQVFQGLTHVVSDWTRMKELTNVMEKTEQNQAIQEFLNWIEDKNFVFLGALDFVKGQLTSRLGFAKVDSSYQAVESSANALMQLSTSAVSVFKIPQRSTIYARLPMDVVILRPSDGRVILLFGLLTTHAHTQNAFSIPLIKEKCQKVLDKSGFEPHWHDSKELIRIFESLPRDDLFQMSVPELLETGLSILQLQKVKNVAVFLRQSPVGSLLTVLIYVRKSRYSSEVQAEIEAFLALSIPGQHLVTHIQLNDLLYARLQVLIELTPRTVYCFDKKGIEEKIFSLTQSWHDQFFELLEKKEKVKFNLHYQERFQPSNGVMDLNLLLSSKEVKGELVFHEGETLLKIFHQDTPLNLSDVFPILDQMGIYVTSEKSYKIELRGTLYYLHVFALGLPAQTLLKEDMGSRIIELIALVLNHKIKSDRLNELILTAELTPRETVVLRAYSRYIQQIQPFFSFLFVESVLVKYPGFVILFVDLFHEKFAISLETRHFDQKLEILRIFLKTVSSAEEDKVLSLVINLLESTLRTNYYQDQCSKSYVSFKFDSSKVSGLPAPRPCTEIFVYSRTMEGIHLRGGKVARGGIRWSDRRSDYRMEVLSLVKAQQVKNTIIVPTGSKGGFFVKTLHGMDPTLEEGIESYKTFIRGMLDITDNIINGVISAPLDVVRYDDDDPYLVVAADKGTASFSDIANSISLEYNFWLQDAFASGGSQGYDHKKLAITSKGAWESVKHHFENLNIDIETTPFTAVGIGDMSGDVFGNGMLLNKNLKLLAAFDHRDIFIDPFPDPLTSYHERKRIFELPRSSWRDYNPSLLSSGSGIYSRKDKHITLSLQAKVMLELEGESFTPVEIMRAILKVPSDLIWFGGIGTYVKSSDESHQDAKDPASNELRVDGLELRAKVIGEGANLGMTQKGRIEYALNGGSLNTDAIDNSAGVNCSDHEVNIKILLSMALQEKTLDLEARNRLLRSMDQEVAMHVLTSNFDQPRSITRTYIRPSEHLPIVDFMIKCFQDYKILDPRLEALPTYQDIQDRQLKKIGLTRPELSVLLSFTKIFLRPIFLKLEILEEKEFEDILFSYFPKQIQHSFPKHILNHPLKQELITTLVLNEIVNTLGLDVSFNLYMHFSSKMDRFVRIYYLLKKLNCANGVAVFLSLENMSLYTLEQLLTQQSMDEVDLYILACSIEFKVEYDELYKHYTGLKGSLHLSVFTDQNSFADMFTFQKLSQELDVILIRLALQKMEGKDVIIVLDHPILKDISTQVYTSLSEVIILLTHLKSFID